MILIPLARHSRQVQSKVPAKETLCFNRLKCCLIISPKDNFELVIKMFLSCRQFIIIANLPLYKGQSFYILLERLSTCKMLVPFVLTSAIITSYVPKKICNISSFTN